MERDDKILKKMPDSSLADVRLQLEYLRKKSARETFVKFLGLHITRAEAEEYKKHFCGGCGKTKGKYPKIWFGEEFCSDCVERFKAGK